MSEITDDALINELQARFDETKAALEETKLLMSRLEDVNQKLERSEGYKTNFLSNMRNELYDPLTSIIGLSTSIINTQQTDAQIINFAKSIHKQAARLEFQLHNIFISAELESGECELSSETFDLAKMILKMVELCTNCRDQKKVNLQLIPKKEEWEKGDYSIVCDAEKLKLVIRNLLDNALKFSADSSTIKIELQQSGTKYCLSIQSLSTP